MGSGSLGPGGEFPVVITVSYHDTVTKLQEVGHEPRGPFDRCDWYRLLEQHGWQPLIAFGQSRARRVALPLMQGSKGLESLTNWFAFSWEPLGRHDEWADEVLTAIAADLRERTHRVDLAPLPGENATADRLEKAFAQSGWLVLREACDENHLLHVEGRSFAEYWAYRPGRMRTTHRRKADKVQIEILTSYQDDAWNTYQSIYERSWKPHEEHAALLQDLAKCESARGNFRLGIARAEGRPVAAQFWTVENGTAYIHKLAHTDEAVPLSAGTTLTAAMFEYVIDTEGVQTIDFGTGSDGYKQDWMENVRMRYRLTCLDWRSPSTWPAIGKRLLGRLARRGARG